MGNLVFQATLGGQVNLVGPNTASTYNINVPAIAGTLVTTGDTGTVTNTMLAGSIGNAKLLNSNVTIGSTAVSLGSTVTAFAGITTLSMSGNLTLSGGTANGVAYLNGSNVVTTGSALTFDGTNLGAGTSSLYPNTRLTIQESASSPSGLAIRNRNSTQTWQVTVDAAAVDDKILAFIDPAAGLVKAAITPSGNFGFGLIPSAWWPNRQVLQLNTASSISSFIGSAGIEYRCNAFLNSSAQEIYQTSAAASIYLQLPGQHQWLVAPSGTAGNAISFTQAMTLFATTNLAVGTSTDYGDRIVAGVATAATLAATDAGISVRNVGESTQVRISRTGSSYSYLGVTGPGGLIYSYDKLSLAADTNNPITFHAGGSQRASINSSGNIVIGTTTEYLTSRATIRVDVSGPSVTAQNEYGNGSQTYRSKMAVGANNTSSYHFVGTVVTTDTVYIFGNGNIVNTNNSYGAISDAKLKDIIGAAPSYWDKFKQYQFVNYTLKSDESKTKLLGLVAQQAQQVSPGVIEETADRDKDGNDIGTTTLGVKYSVVTLQAEVVLQEAQSRIEQLEAIITQLKARLDAANL
jgi:hypothetical protein